MKNWLLKPFPFVQSARQAVSISVCIGLFVLLFLLIFKPFGIVRLNTSALFYLTGYGVISFLVTFFVLGILPVLFPSPFNSSNWSVIKSILIQVLILLLISIFNWLYGKLLFELVGSAYHDTPAGFIEMVGMTISVGIFPVLLINYFLEKQFFTRNIKRAKSLENVIGNTPKQLPSNLFVDIPIDANKTSVVSSQNLLCVKAEGGNYVTVFWLEGNEVKNQLWRITLKSLLSKIESNQNILQCHKSYLINRSFIMEVTGNARTLVLRLKGLDFEIPVSRNFPRELVKHYHLKQA